MNLHRFASRRIAAKSRGDSESLSMRPLALLSVVPECSCRESGGFSFRVHKFSRSKDLKTLDPRQHRSGKTEILDQSLNSPPDGSPGKFSAMRSEQILQRTWFSVREFSAAKGCKFPGLQVLTTARQSLADACQLLACFLTVLMTVSPLL